LFLTVYLMPKGADMVFTEMKKIMVSIVSNMM